MCVILVPSPFFVTACYVHALNCFGVEAPRRGEIAILILR
jgi:hypothetical protein